MRQKFLIRIILSLGLLAIASTLFALPSNEEENMINIYLKSFRKSFGDPNSAQSQSIAQIIMSFMIYGDRDLKKLSYILATAWHESKLLTVKEKRGNPGSDLYIKQEKYWNTGFYGRGFVQLTHKENYIKLGKILGIDLVLNPDLALDRRFAADIIVIGMMKGLFTGLPLNNYINNIADYYNARRVVNGLDKAQLISDYTDSINKNLDF